MRDKETLKSFTDYFPPDEDFIIKGHEAACPNCWLVYTKALPACGNCDGPSVYERGVRSEG